MSIDTMFENSTPTRTPLFYLQHIYYWMPHPASLQTQFTSVIFALLPVSLTYIATIRMRI